MEGKVSNASCFKSNFFYIFVFLEEVTGKIVAHIASIRRCL